MTNNWKAVKREYIASGLTLREIARKCGVSYSSLRKVAAEEKWSEQREQHRQRSEQKLINKMEENQSRISDVYYNGVEKLLRKVVDSIDSIPVEEVDLQRKVASTFRDLKECMSIKSTADRREQEAKIKNLEKQLESSDASNEVVVRIEGGLDEYAK